MRRRPLHDFLEKVSRLTEMDGTATQESVLNDPEVIEWMSKQKPAKYVPRLWGHTKLINLVMSQIEIATGKPMKRPIIPGERMREANNRNRLRSTLTRIGVQ